MAQRRGADRRLGDRAADAGGRRGGRPLSSAGGEGPAFYDRLWATDWRALPEHGPLADARARLVVRALRPRLVPGARLLDVGSGDGTFLLQLLRRFPRLDAHGIDFSAAAQSAAPPALRERLRIGDVERLAEHFPPASFDLVTSSEVLEHVEDPDAVLRGIAHVLRPGGEAALTVPHGGRHWSDLDVAGGHRRRFETAELDARLRAAGLEPLRLTVWGGPVGLPYYALTKRLGARRTARAAQTAPARLAARLLRLLLRLDDLFPNRFGFQLVAHVRRPA